MRKCLFPRPVISNIEVVEVPKEVPKESFLTDETVKEVPIVEKETEEEEPMVAEIVQKKKITPPKVAKATQDALRSLLEGASATESSDEEGGIDNPGIKGSDQTNKIRSVHYQEQMKTVTPQPPCTTLTTPLNEIRSSL